MSAAPKLLLDFQELADALGLHIATVYRMKDRGELPVPIVHIGRGPRVRVADVESWLERLADEAAAEDERVQIRRTPAGMPSKTGVASITRQVRRGSA